MQQGDAELVKHVVAVLATSEARLYEQVASTFRWLLATLFTANGGALIAILGNDTYASNLPIVPLTLFAAGVVCSVLMAISNAVYAAKALMPTTELNLMFAGFAAGTSTWQEVESKMKALDEPGWLKWPMYGAGGLSFACMLGGMISFACWA